MKGFFKNNKKSIFGGLVATIFTGIGIFLLGQISGYEAKRLLDISHTGLNMLCNTIILASATILTLLLTLLGISTSSRSKLKKGHYNQVLDIAKIDTILLVVSLIMFQFFNIPITEAENIELHWFSKIYWFTLAISSVLSGTMITIVLMLYSTVADIIHIVGLKKQDHQLVMNENEN